MKAVALKIQSWFLALTGPLGGWALLLIALADSSFLSLPEVNDILIVTLSIQSPQRMLYYCSMTTIGSILGCLLLYLVGRKGGEVLTRKKFAPRQLEKIGGWYRRFGILAVIIPSILPPPTPFKIFVLSASVFKVSPAKFLLAITLGRGFRYFLEGYLAVRYGQQALFYMKHHYPTVAWVLLALLVSGFLILLLFRRMRPAPPPAR